MLLSSHILAEVEALCDRVTHHPPRPRRGERHARRAAPSHPHVDLRRDRAATDRDRVAARRARRRRRRPPRRRSTSTRASSTLPSAICPGWASRRWPAIRRRWRSCSSATTATSWRWRSPTATTPRRIAVTELDGHAALVRLILRRDRVRLALWVAAIGVLVVSVAVQRRGAVPDRRPTSPPRAAMIRRQRRSDRHERPGGRPGDARRADRVRDRRVHVRPDRVDEHLPRRPAHPSRGGERPDRAGARRRRRAQRAAHGHAARRRRSPMSRSACWSPLWHGPAPGCAIEGSLAFGCGAGVGRSVLRRGDGRDRPGHRAHPARATGSPQRCSARRTCCAPPATRQRGAVVVLADRVGSGGPRLRR